MDTVSITKDLISLQKQSFNNLFDAMIHFQEEAEKTCRLWANRVGSHAKAPEMADQWHALMRKGRDDYRQLINDGYTRMEDYFAELVQKKTSNK